MTKVFITAGAIALAMVGLAACETGVTRPDPDPSFFRASIDGAISTAFEGSGQFITTIPAPHVPARPTFTLFSAGIGASSHQTFQLSREVAEIPAVGTYLLGDGAADFRATFLRHGPRGETLEGYAAYEGTLEITRSGADGIEGTFRMSAFQMIAREGARPATRFMFRTPESPTIEVEGTFRASAARG
jgi:hypothetical protein